MVKRIFKDIDKGLLPILITVAVMAFGMSFVLPIIPLLIQSLGASPSTIGQITSVFFISFTLVTLPIGKWIERFMPKRLIMLGLFVYGVSIFLMIFPTESWWFYLIRIAQGFGSACLFVPTESAINVLSSPEKRGTNMGLYAMVFALGMALGPPIGAWLYEINRVASFILCFIISIISLLIMWIGFEDKPASKKTSYLGLKKLAGVIKIPLLVALCYAIVEVSVIGFLSLHLKELQITSSALGFIFTLFGIGGIVSPYPAGKAADRFGKLNLLCILGGILFVITFCFNFVGSYFGIAALIFGVGFVAGGLYPIALSLIADLIPADRMGTGNAAFSLSFGLGCIFGPLLTGWVMDLMGISHLFYPMTAAALILLLFTITDVKEGRHDIRRKK